ncbi:MAG: hypothetical protein O9327_02075 [Polaromonas sp.]|nr:hypothetical protein [Polaromonas sp.]
MSDPTESILQRSPATTFLSVVVIMLSTIVGIHLWSEFEQRREEKVLAQRIDEATRHVPKLFEALVFREERAAGEPDVIWRGAESTILESSKVDLRKPLGGGHLEWQVLAQTKRGRFFVVSWYLLSRQECEKQVPDCMVVSWLEEWTPEQVKERLRKSDKADLYRKLFNEEMRPPAIDA